MSSFRNLRIVDNFYQTSAFFPMPTVVTPSSITRSVICSWFSSWVLPGFIFHKGQICHAPGMQEHIQHLP